jgi:hypothetical protein
VHGLAFLVFVLVLAHAALAGTDVGAGWARALYWGSGASVLFLTVYRVLAARVPPAGRAAPAPHAAGRLTIGLSPDAAPGRTPYGGPVGPADGRPARRG